MDCKGLTHDLLLDHVEGLCEEPLRGPIDRHLQDCVACRERRHEVQRITSTVRTLLVAPPPKALVDQLDAAVLGGLDKLAPVARPKPNRMPFWLGGIAAAAAVALIAAAVSWSGSGGTTTSEPGDAPVVQTPPSAPGTSREPARVPAQPAPEPVTRPIEEPPKPADPSTEPVPAPAPPPKVDKTQPPAPEPALPPPPPPPPDTSPRSRMPSSEPANPGPAPAPEPKRPQPPPEPAFARGDLNGDRVIDARDVEHLDSDIREGRTPDLGRADLTGDGRVDCGDVLALLRVLERHP